MIVWNCSEPHEIFVASKCKICFLAIKINYNHLKKLSGSITKKYKLCVFLYNTNLLLQVSLIPCRASRPN